MKYIVANWKQNFTIKDAQNWIDKFDCKSTDDTKIIVAGCFTHLPLLKQTAHGFDIAAQNISTHLQGSFTGQVGVPQVQELASYCLIGHPDVRRELADTSKDVAIKAKLLVNGHITPIVCVDSLFLEEQISLLKHELLDLSTIIIAFEPAGAVGTGKPESPMKVNEICFKIKVMTNKSCPVIYGGSINPENVQNYLKEEYLDGLLIGKASLDPANFAKIISCA